MAKRLRHIKERSYKKIFFNKKPLKNGKKEKGVGRKMRKKGQI